MVNWMTLFTGSVGSSWLMETLSTYAGVCVITYEPIDDFRLKNINPQMQMEMVYMYMYLHALPSSHPSTGRVD